MEVSADELLIIIGCKEVALNRANREIARLEKIVNALQEEVENLTHKRNGEDSIAEQLSKTP